MTTLSIAEQQQLGPVRRAYIGTVPLDYTRPTDRSAMEYHLAKVKKGTECHLVTWGVYLSLGNGETAAKSGNGTATKKRVKG